MVSLARAAQQNQVHKDEKRNSGFQGLESGRIGGIGV